MEVIESQHTMPQATASQTAILRLPSLAVSIFSGFGGEGTATNPRLLQGVTRDSIEVEQHIPTKGDWLAIDIVFVFIFARTKVAPPGKVHEGPQGVDFDESAPGDSDTFI